MKLAGAIVLFGAAVYTGCAMIAVSIYAANGNPKPTSFSDAFWDHLGVPVLIPGLLLWVIGLGLLSPTKKDKE